MNTVINIVIMNNINLYYGANFVQAKNTTFIHFDPAIDDVFYKVADFFVGGAALPGRTISARSDSILHKKNLFGKHVINNSMHIRDVLFF